jgi:hypothetical protein
MLKRNHSLKPKRAHVAYVLHTSHERHTNKTLIKKKAHLELGVELFKWLAHVTHLEWQQQQPLIESAVGYVTILQKSEEGGENKQQDCRSLQEKNTRREETLA